MNLAQTRGLAVHAVDFKLALSDPCVQIHLLSARSYLPQTWRSTDCMRGLDWSSVRCYSSTGEASAPEDYHWLSARAGYKPVIEHCGGAILMEA